MQNYNDKIEIRTNRALSKIKTELPKYMTNYFDYCIAVRNYSLKTTLQYARDLLLFYKFLAQANPNIPSSKDVSLDYIEQLTPLDLLEFITKMSSYTYKDGQFVDDTETGAKLVRNGANGKARKISVLKGFYKYLYGMGLIKTNPASVITSPKIPKKEIIRLERQESNHLLDDLHKIVQSQKNIPEKDKKLTEKYFLRDLTIITLLLGTGIRVSECEKLNIGDIIWHKQAIKIIRKGGNEDIVYYNDDIESLLLSYIEAPERIEPLQKLQIDPAANDTAIFISRRGTRLTDRSIERIVKEHSQNAGITDKHITPHKLRSTFGTNTYQQTGDVYLTADLLGHSGLGTVKRYADIDEDKKLTARDNVDWT